MYTIAVTENDVYIRATVLQLHHSAENVWSHPSALTYLNEANCKNAGVYCKFILESDDDGDKRLCLIHSAITHDVALNNEGATSGLIFAVYRVELLMSEGIRTIMLGIGEVCENQVCQRRRKTASQTSLHDRLTAISTSVNANLIELENLKDELENYKDLLEEKAQTARSRADSYLTWNERAEDRASELEDKFSEIEELYDEIDNAYDELYQAESTLSTAVIGAYVLD